MYSENDPDNEKQSDDEDNFVGAAHDLRDKYKLMMNKYQLLLMKESMVSNSRLFFHFKNIIICLWTLIFVIHSARFEHLS